MIKDKPYVIAECGVNWEEDLFLAENMVVRAHKSGADAVKFQCFDESVVDDESLLKFSLSLSEVIMLKDLAHRVGIEFLCTPMYRDAVDLLQPHVDRWKVREADGPSSEVAERLVDRSINRKTIINSVHGEPNSARYSDGTHSIYNIYCVPNYPTEPEDINLEHMLKSAGFSCHCPDMDIWEKVRGTNPEIVEVHVTPERDGSHPDDNVSYEFDELSEIVDILKEK